MKPKDMLTILLCLAAMYAALVLAAFLNQRNMMYFPDRARTLPGQSGVGDMQVVSAVTQDGLQLEGWYKPPADPQKPVIVFFHGNAGGLYGRGFKARPFLDSGYGFLFGEYRGFSGNPGKPTQNGLFADARAWTKWLADNGMPIERTVFFGESLGTGIAVRMAAEFPDAAALVLEAPYTSMADVAGFHYGYLPAKYLTLDRYDSLSVIGGVKPPLLVLHGEMDSVVPFSMGKTLYEAANPPKEFAAYERTGHVGIFDRGGAERIMDFLARYP